MRLLFWLLREMLSFHCSGWQSSKMTVLKVETLCLVPKLSRPPIWQKCPNSWTRVTTLFLQVSESDSWAFWRSTHRGQEVEAAIWDRLGPVCPDGGFPTNRFLTYLHAEAQTGFSLHATVLAQRRSRRHCGLAVNGDWWVSNTNAVGKRRQCADTSCILEFHNTSGHLHLHLGFNLYACLPPQAHTTMAVLQTKNLSASWAGLVPGHATTLPWQHSTEKNKQKSWSYTTQSFRAGRIQ